MEPTQEKIPERAVLVGLDADVFPREQTATAATLRELAALLETAGGTCVGTLLQSRPAPDPHSFLGEGKAQELCQLVEKTQAEMVVFDNDLTPSQIRTLREMTGVTVLDRSALILDIFAQRARTKEGRLQVELAQYQYLLPKLSGMGASLSRQGGGIGTRGPGETKLETDRRHIRERITRLRAELAEVRKVRAVQRERRIRNEVPVVALVGYTNAGKSSLLNALTGAGIAANNRLFDTLDTTTRQLAVSDTLDVLLSDTVGFIAKLPHHLIEAFQATLEELQYADLLVEVIDASDPERDAQREVVERLVRQLAKPGTPVLYCYNKCDMASEIPAGRDVLAVSAKTGAGLEQLLRKIEEKLDRGMRRVTLLLPYAMAGQLDALHTQGKVEQTAYEAEGIRVRCVIDPVLYGRLRPYVTEGA